MGRLDISNLLLLALNILKVIFTVVLLELNFQLFSMVYGILFTNLLFIIFVSILICSKFDKAILKPVMFSKKSTLELLNFGSSIIGMQVMNMFSFPFIKVILAKTIGIEAVGIFELSSKAGYALRTLFEKGLFAIMPEISYISRNFKGVNLGSSVIYNKSMKMSKYLLFYAVPILLLFSISAPIWLKLWLGDNYNKDILSGYLLLQPGIIAGLLVLPSFYSLMATNYQKFCMYEAALRSICIIALFAIFWLFNMNIYYAFLFVSLSVILSNIYVFRIFQIKFS